MIMASPIVSFFEPFLKMLAGPGFQHATFERFAEMMEDRDNIELLIIEIERRSQTQRDEDKEEKRRRKELRREAKQKRKALRGKQ